MTLRSENAENGASAAPHQTRPRTGLFAARRIAKAVADFWHNGAGPAHFAYLHDVFVAGLACVCAILVGNRLATAQFERFDIQLTVSAFAGIAALIYLVNRPYRSLWRYFSLSDAVGIVYCALLTTFAHGVFVNVLFGARLMTWRISIVAFLLAVTFLCAPRIAARLYRGDLAGVRRAGAFERIPLLVVGAGDATELFIRAVNRDPGARFRIVGIVDEMGTHLRRSIHGVEVLGSLTELESVVSALDHSGNRPRRLVLTDQNLSPVALRAMLDEAERLGLTLSRTSKATDLHAGIGEAIDIKPVAIEDLLGRPQTLLDRASMRQLCNGRRILVTGAGGTIGSELVRQISSFGPAEIVLVDNSELHLYEIDLEVRSKFPEIRHAVVMADVRDSQRLDQIFAEYRPEFVFHAAAMKHVPMVELHPSEGILTNVVGTKNVADAARRHAVRAMVLISTDKAVNPTSVMGASKRVAECYCQALDISGEGQSGTRYFTVRFGNVLGSTGSVVPLFQKQLAQGGPLTVTHPAVTRYFMTTREAVALVLQASALGTTSDEKRGTIFTLEMGDPVRIQDLARQIIRLAGFRPGADVDIVYTGLRPGEKLYEEPLHQSEELQPTELSGILLAAPRTADFVMLNKLMNDLIAAATAKDTERCLQLVTLLVPEYTPTVNEGGGLAPLPAPASDAKSGDAEVRHIA